MAQTILYYPNINIKDGQWLRNALLYWDNISSIVPYDNYGELSEDLLFLQDKGIYEPIYPQDLFCSKYSDDFCKAVVKRISRYEKKQEQSINLEKVRVHKEKIYAPALHTLVHYRKLPSELLDYFTDKKYINNYNNDGWMEIDAKVARIYMRTLAEYSIKCSEKDIVLGTDKVTNSREIYNSARSRNVSSQCCKINILKCLPQPTLDTSFEDILAFKSARKAELYAFRMELRKLEENIYRSQSFEEIKHYENSFIEAWQRCSKDYYAVLKDSNIKFALGNLSTLVALPFVGSVITEYIGQNFSDIVQTSTCLLQMAINYIDYKDKINPQKSDGGFAYIINARENGLIQF